MNGGSNYDVITPPDIVLTSVGSGTTALVQPVISGSVKDVQVDPQYFDIYCPFSLVSLNSYYSIFLSGFLKMVNQMRE